MRGFAGPQVNVLYNGIWTGPADITSRWMDTANLGQVEFLKGPSSLMSGLNAIGGSVNYVSRQPTTGPIRNEADVYLDSFGSFRSHFGSGGSTPVRGLDYRFDVSGAEYNSFIDGGFRDVTGLATQFDYRVTRSVQDVCRYRVQEGFRSCLLGHAGCAHLVCRVTCRVRSSLGHRHQYL